jgi:hypothetical protein
MGPNMLKLIKITILLAVFAAGYYFGGRPGSPDVAAWARQCFQQADRARSDITARAEQDDSSLPEAAMKYAFDGRQ